MAKKPYKIEETKQDNTIIFRVPNTLFESLSKLANKENKSVNQYAKEKLSNYIYGPGNESTIKLYEEYHKNLDQIKYSGEALIENTEKILMKKALIESEKNRIKVIEDRIKSIKDKLKREVEESIFITNKIRTAEGKPEMTEEEIKNLKTQLKAMFRKGDQIESI